MFNFVFSVVVPVVDGGSKYSISAWMMKNGLTLTFDPNDQF
jgi:hypothetical protein